MSFEMEWGRVKVGVDPTGWHGKVAAGAIVLLAVLTSLLPPLYAADDNFSLRVSLERSRLRGELRKLRDELERVEARYEKLKGTAGVRGGVGAFLSQERSELRSRRQELLSRIRDVEWRFRDLRRRVLRKYGKLPGWWSDSPYP